MDLHHHLTVLHPLSPQHDTPLSSRFVSAESWRSLMLKVLAKLRKKQFYDPNLVQDMAMIVQKMPEEGLIETIMHIQPFRPNFLRMGRQSRQKSEYSQELAKEEVGESRRLQSSSIFKFRREIHSKVRDSIFEVQEENPKNVLLEETLALIIGEETLSKEFQKPYHPYRIIIDHFLFLLEHKYKNYINSGPIEVQQVQEKLLYDLNLLQEFIIKASVPYLKIFTCGNKQQRMNFQVELVAFIKKYIEKHARINQLIKKIIKYTLKRTNFAKMEENVPNFIDITTFKVEEKFQIQGEYFHSINALIEFAQSNTPNTSLRRLQELRRCMLKDIDEYYSRLRKEKQSFRSIERNGYTQLKMSVETQLQVLKFLLSKAKIFITDILTQLKYLETVLGEEDLSYKYDDSSFMYAQLTVAIEILSLEYA